MEIIISVIAAFEKKTKNIPDYLWSTYCCVGKN